MTADDVQPATTAANSVMERVLQDLTAIRAEMIDDLAQAGPRLANIHPNFQQSALNLLNYLTLRRRDLRRLQVQLAALGLSSLGRAESHVVATLDAVLNILRRQVPVAQPTQRPTATLDFVAGKRLLANHTETLLGSGPDERNVRIMVTMPSEAAQDYLLVHDLLEQGMNCMRINCAHDDSTAWLGMIENLRRAEQAVGRTCRVVMDLGGPKLRTGPLEPGPKVVKIRPTRNAFGQVTAPARVWLTANESPQLPPTSADASLPLPADWIQGLSVGERISFTDARDSSRILEIVDVTAGGCWAELKRTAYLVPGTKLRRTKGADAAAQVATVGDLPATENLLTLHSGDLLVVSRDVQPGRAATFDRAGQLLTPATIGCTLPEVFANVRAGESIWFDDGKIGGGIEKVEETQVHVRIQQARARGAKLRADKGINLPDSDLQLAALTAQDLADLPFIAEHADVVELSFANGPEDVAALQRHLVELGGRQPAIVLKIETRRGFENLPEMLLTAMEGACCGVMIARGDLAVECGFDRLAEVQEEILWISEAAHVPVIWATQVLESLAKEGLPSRSEITDAAMGYRAECVMLNKGPYIVGAVRVLNDILQRMQAHQTKKQSMLRELKLAHSLDSVDGNSPEPT